MQFYDSWIVAAALMLCSDNAFHYKSLAKEVVKTELSTLGLKGSDPQQTLGVVLRKRSKVFSRVGNGYYKLLNPEIIEKNNHVQEVLTLIKK